MSDVRLVLTHDEYPDFAAAEPHAISQVTDGDGLWAYIKYPSPLTDWGSYFAAAHLEEDRNARTIHLGIGAAGSQEIWQGETLDYTAEQAAAIDEVKVCLSRGLPGEKRSLQFVIALIANGAPGMWQNEIYLYRQTEGDWGDKEFLASAPLTVDVAAGMPKYTRAANDYSYDQARGEAESNTIPYEGRFFDKQIRAQMLEALDNKGYAAEKFYFSCDDWEVTGGQLPEWKQVSGAFLYRRDGQGYYGQVILAYPYIAALSTWDDVLAPPVVEFDFPISDEQYAAAPGAFDMAAEVGGQGGAPDGAAAAGDDVLGQIAKLADLHAAGILTDDEFAAKKAELLSRL